MLGALLELILPMRCAGCTRRSGRQLCGTCTAGMIALRAQRVRPDPEPAGLPPTYALAAYGGAVRGALLQYKERHRHGLAAPLGDRLADVVARAVGGPVLLVPIPATAAAARRRHGDHIVRLADRAARTLRRQGRAVAVVPALRALPKHDSAELSAVQRAAAARHAFAVRPGRVAAVRAAAARGAAVLLVDDIVTTGATLAAAAGLLAAGHVPVTACAVVAATQRRAAPFAPNVTPRAAWGNPADEIPTTKASFFPTRGD